MNKLNFEKLKSIKTPDEWLENAVNIPNKKNSIPLYRHTSFLASAVCVVLCMIVGVILIFKVIPEKIPVSDNSDVKILSTTVASENSDIPITTSDAVLQSSIPKDNSGHNEKSVNNYRGRGTTQTVTEPSERSTDKSNTPNTQAAENNSSNLSPSNSFAGSNGGENQTIATVNPNLPDTDNTEGTHLSPSDSENTNAAIPDGKPSSTPEQSETTVGPIIEEPTGIYTMPIYLHINSIKGFDYDNTVGCHMKRVGGEDLYSYNSVYEKCESNDSPSVLEEENVCIEYKNNGPNDITFGLYEVTFYDIKGNIITHKVNISGNYSVHIFI